MCERGRVLIFDDEPAVARSIALMAQHNDMDTMSVSDAPTFFEKVREWDPTHIILDLIMPDMDGVEVLQELARQGCTASIAISSGVGNRVLNAAQRSATEHGLHIAGVLPKPFTMSALQAFLATTRDSLSLSLSRARSKAKDHETITAEDLNNAIAQRQFSLVYQPKIECATRMLKGFEALVRWQHPTKGMIMPDRFIQMSERLGLIGLITDQVVDQAFQWFSGIAAAPHMTLSVNISAKTLGNKEFPDELEIMCRRASIPASSVILEVTETAASDDQLLALDMFTRLRMKGFSVSIDDFGIGNSSLALLARLPFSEIKVDKSFAITASQSEESRAIIKSTVDLSHSLDLCVVTEGVEDRETLEFLQNIGCDFAQGYHIARPMAGDQVVEWMLQRSESRQHNLL
jgi:EAL domain-containing protein (putative c-di-GMP-specific phosphodiesterase class I)/FixJ family two-component response regulator